MASSNCLACTFSSPKFPSLFSLLLLPLLLAINHEMVPAPFARAASASDTANITLSALLDFKNSCIYTDPTKFLDAWNNTHDAPSYCTWPGVQCSPGTQIVISLMLPSKQLEGYLCPLLGDFPQLSYLDVSGNSFYGEIPTELGKLTSLRHLNLSGNQLEGRIPNSLANCTHLQYLDLSVNSLSSEFPSFITTLTSLVHLDLSTNTITGQLPPKIGLLLNLEFFQASSANLIGSMPPSITNCTNLAWLDLSTNNLSGPLPSDWSKLAARLQHVNLEYNHFTGTIPATLFNCTRLINLKLDSNSLSGSIPQNIGKLSQVQWLSFEGNSDLGGRIPDTIGGCAQVQFLDLGYTAVGDGNLPSSLSNLSNLQTLRLSSSRFSGTLSEQVKNLTTLSELRLDMNAFEGRIPEGLGELKGLKTIDLSKNSLYGTISFNFSPFTTSIDLSHNSLTGAIPSLRGIMLQAVRLSNNHFTGKIPESLGNNSEGLYLLDLSMNKLDGEIPKTFGNMGSLKYLDLSQNELSGALPVLSTSLPSPLFLNFSFNELEGMIPNVQPYSNSSPACFLGNPGLCGFPLSVRCKHVASSAHVVVFVSIALGAFLLAIFCASFWWWHRSRSRKYLNKCLKPQSIIAWTPQDMRKATDDFDGANVIGSGAMSVCYKGVMKDGRVVAVKTFDSIELEARESFVNELKTLGRVKHRNLVKVLGYCVAKEEVALVMEFMELGDLDENLHSANKCLLWKDRVNVAIDVAEGLIYLHHEYVQPIIHCDLKPRNILLGSDMVAKVSDFGIAKLLDKDQSKGFSTSNFKGTFGYIAPEFASGSRISTKADVYSYGVLLMELVTGVRPTSEKLPGVTLHEWTRTFYNSRRTKEVLDEALKESAKRDMTIMKEAEVLLGIGLRCSSEWVKERPTMKDVRKFLSSIKNQDLVHYPQILQA